MSSVVVSLDHLDRQWEIATTEIFDHTILGAHIFSSELEMRISLLLSKMIIIVLITNCSRITDAYRLSGSPGRRRGEFASFVVVGVNWNGN